MSYSFTYAGVTVGGSSSIILSGVHLIALDYDSLDVQFSAIVAESSVGSFRTQCAALEEAYRTPYADLVINIGGANYTYSQSDNTLFDAQPTIRKDSQSNANTGLSREYICTVRGGRAADLADQADGYVGLVRLQTRVQTPKNGQRRISISGAYTAQPGDNNASAQYDAQITDLEDAIKDSVDAGADWEELDAETFLDRNDRVTAFAKAFQEILYKQSTTVDDHPAIKDHSMVVQSAEVGRDDSLLNVSRPTEVTVGFSAAIDSTVTKDLKTLWSTVIRPAMLDAAQSYLTVTISQIAVLGSNPGFDPTTNTVRASLRLLVYGPSALVAAIVQETVEITKGFKLVPVFSQISTEAYIMPSSGSGILQTTVNLLVRGDESAALSQLALVAPERPYTPARVGSGSGVMPGSGEAISPLAVPRFGLAGGGWLEANRSQPVARRYVDGVGLTRISQTIISVYVTPATGFASGVSR